jgi:hypothetical protein
MNQAGMKSATILGTDRNLLLVIGNIDWTDIIQKLRQNVCCTEVLEDMIHFERKPNLSKKLDISQAELVKQVPSTFVQLTELMLLDMLNNIVCEVPTLMSSLSSMSSLSITVGTLRDEYIQVLGSIPSLSELYIQVEQPMQSRNKRLVIDHTSKFLCLRRLTIRSPKSEMELLFAHGAMENLQKLELQFGPLKTTEFIDFDFGIENLSSLRYVLNGIIYYDKQSQRSLDSAVRRALDKNPSKPRMIRPKVSTQINSYPFIQAI